MNFTQPQTSPFDTRATPVAMDIEEASRLALTAFTTDLEEWARDAAIDGIVVLTELFEVLRISREVSVPTTIDGVVAITGPSGEGGLDAVA